MIDSVQPAWLPLLQRPYENLFGPRTVWDLRMANGVAVRIERGCQGLNNRLYRVHFDGQVFACKLFVVDERRRAQREWGALRSLHASGGRYAPEPVSFSQPGPLPQPVVVSRWVEGQPLAEQALSSADLAGLITALGHIHRTPPAPGIEPLLAWHQPASLGAYEGEFHAFDEKIEAWISGPGVSVRGLPNWAADLPEMLPAIVQRLQLAGAAIARWGVSMYYPYPALIRVDGDLENVLRTETGQIIFMDWERSGWGDPAFDLAGWRWHPKGQRISQAHWDTALASYPVFPDDSTFADRLALYSDLLPIWWAGRSTLYLLEGAHQAASQPHVGAVPARMYHSVRRQLDFYLAALGLIPALELAGAEGD